MSIKGVPSSAWVNLFDDMVGQLLQLVADSWETLNGPLENKLENTVSNALLLQLQTHRTARTLPFYIFPQLPELHPAENEHVGQLDIAFFPSNIEGSPSESIYFCLECKWLNTNNNGKIRRLGYEYVKHGMMRFVTGRYAKAVKNGGMVGYVLDGDIYGAIDNIQENITRNCIDLKMDNPGILQDSSIARHISTARETFHYRNDETLPFRVHHLFFAAGHLFD